MSLSECDETNQYIKSCYECFFFVFLFFFSVFILSTKICYFYFPGALNEKSKFRLVHVIVSIEIMLPPETITDAMEQTISVTKGLAYGNTSSVTINFNNEFCEVPQK